MTKKRGPVWKHWTVITQNQVENNRNNSHPPVQCNYCTKIFDRAVPSRMQIHLDKECPGAPDNAKSKQNVGSQNSIPETTQFHPNIALNSILTDTPNRPVKRIKTQKIESFVDCMSEEEQEVLEFQLAQALYSAGVSFSFVDNPLVIQFFQHLRPAFKLPNRKKLADDLLDDVYDEVKAQADEQISKAKSLCMVSDGEESHTGEWIANQIIQQMEIIGTHKFSSVITDTASVMKAAWKRIEEKYSHIVCLGCNSHIINLLIGDILKIDEIKDIVNNGKMIVNYFKSHIQAAAKLKRIQIENYNKEIALVLPTLTRWGTHLSCFQSLLKSKIALEQVLMDPKIRQKINREVRNNVLSEEFWEMADLITKILEPMVVILKLFESDTSTLSTVYSHFNKLINKISELSCEFSEYIQQLIHKRWEYSYHPVMMAAYMLDPRFLEESEDADIEAIGYAEFTEFTNRRFGQEESVKLFAELVVFRQKNSPYDNETIWLSSSVLSPSIWWQSWPKSELQQLAIKILSIPTSSAAAERKFSTFGFIHNKICNRLQNDRVKKLVFIYGNLWMHKRGLKLKKNKFIHDQRKIDNNDNGNDIGNNSNDHVDNDNDSDDDRFIGLELNITDIVADE
ncbi:hypothetical protein RclHR1_07730012 [Rhizophagus clarus]|uniref:BED-type domain-containing protein n=1 Tax=Rhizophagus clarus TaxID=94130 RepID=A0A2Z6SM04_9GLOM|nr:hypothetical protein RclHR1_07730012 [Rhizophagus clarus]